MMSNQEGATFVHLIPYSHIMLVLYSVVYCKCLFIRNYFDFGLCLCRWTFLFYLISRTSTRIVLYFLKQFLLIRIVFPLPHLLSFVIPFQIYQACNLCNNVTLLCLPQPLNWILFRFACSKHMQLELIRMEVYNAMHCHCVYINSLELW